MTFRSKLLRVLLTSLGERQYDPRKRLNRPLKILLSMSIVYVNRRVNTRQMPPPEEVTGGWCGVVVVAAYYHNQDTSRVLLEERGR